MEQPFFFLSLVIPASSCHSGLDPEPPPVIAGEKKGFPVANESLPIWYFMFTGSIGIFPGVTLLLPDWFIVFPAIEISVTVKCWVHPVTGVADPDAESIDPDAASIDPDAESIDPDAESIDPDAVSIDPDAVSIDPDAESIDPDAESIDPVG